MALMSTPGPTPVRPNLGPLFGALYLGATGAAMLYGVTMLQIYFYFKHYKRDGIFLKSAVVFLWLVDTLHVAFAIAELWHYLIDSFGNYAALQVLVWTHRMQVVFAMITVLSVRSLYTQRVWTFSRDRNRFWRWILIIILVGVYASAIIVVIWMYYIVTFPQIRHVLWTVELSFITGTLFEVMLTAAMCHLLYPETTALAKTKSMMNTIIRYVIISGALTSMLSVVTVITLFVMPNNNVFLGITFLWTKLYVNSYLAMLNARKSIRDAADNTTTVQVIDFAASTDFGRSACGEEAGSLVREARDKEESKSGVDVVCQRDETIGYVGEV